MNIKNCRLSLYCRMRQKLTRNFNKTFGRGYDITNKQSSVSHLDAIDKSQVVGNTYRERFVSTNDIATNGYQLHGKLLDGTGMRNDYLHSILNWL